ncbi:glycoside hydrolase family 10 protein [Paenibacillus roseipurpureus]|uniref:Family 10 glycosylhydrolase n=1 Tax=Paenibacillus roseopurpureus TaxID=2918901 RepID=A0AA96RLG7_9BACL|nr:family 10 glycosylhydrolase [Paenibacillus sp. MBLB1832]WNR45394.1 family 10 glycosylhydrolase [Paenibacillus sp. MBLB1832]
MVLKKMLVTKTMKAIAVTVFGLTLIAGPFQSNSSDRTNKVYAESVSNATIVTASNGKTFALSGVNMTRGSGMLVEYTPEYGYKTATNAFGAEVIAIATGIPNQYQVTGMNSAFGDQSKSGNSDIPENGFVLSAGPGGTPDVRRFLIDNFKVGDIFTVAAPIEQSASATLSAIDPTAETNPEGAVFDGFRGPNQLNVYTPVFGPSTRTNQYGNEITVKNGIVTSVGGANSEIPSDGFIVSGHGTNAAWLSNIAMVGAKVTIRDHTVTISKDATSYLYQAETAIATAQTSIDQGYAMYVNAPFDLAKQDVAQAQTLLESGRVAAATDSALAVMNAKQAVAAAQQAYYRTLPSRVAEARGVWYRPVEKNQKEVATTLDRMQAAGFNELYLETWFGGYTIYPSQTASANGIENQNPSFKGWDPLQAFSEEAQKRGIALHAWLDGFFVGIDKTGGPVLRAHPEWAAVERDDVQAGKPMPQHENGYFWLDLINPDVQRYLLNITKEMVVTYGLSGVDLDYMRLPMGSDWKMSFNFSTYARTAYQQQVGIDPYTIEKNLHPEEWKSYTDWISMIEDEFVKSVYSEMKDISNQVIVSATPEPGAEADKIGAWSHYVDVVIPQAYSYSTSSILQSVQQHKSQIEGGGLIYSGIYPMYVHMNAFDTVSQVLAARDIDNGTTIFAFGQASPLSVKALKQGPWRKTAISTGVHPLDAVSAMLHSMKDDFNEVYIPRNALRGNETSKSLLRKFDDIQYELTKAIDKEAAHQETSGGVAASQPNEKLQHFDHVSLKLNEASKEIQLYLEKGDLEQVVAHRLVEQLEQAQKILMYAMTKRIR